MRVRKLSCYFQIDRTEDSLINSRFQSLLGLAENGTTSLAEALRQFQNLRAIKIWQNWRSSWFWGLNNKESQYLTAYPIGYRLFQNIIHGLATSQNSIEGLTLGSDRPFCPEWNLVGFNLFPWVFAKMERLKVVLPKLAGNTGFGEYGLNSRGLKTLIELSPYLKELHLSIDMSLTDEPFVPDLDIPKLQHLVFNGLLFPDISVLVSFLGRHIATLKTVELDHITLLNSSRTLRRKLFRDGLNRSLAVEMRLPIGVPLAVVIASLVLAVLALIAGKHPGFMEDYHIIMLNTTYLGKNLLKTPTPGQGDPSPTSCGPLKGALSELCASATAVAGSAVDSAISDLATVANDAADKLADKLGIHQWYSLHVMNICQGAFTPNATAVGAGYHVSGCTEPLKSSNFNISALLSRELGAGPFHIELADIGFTQDLQKELDKIPSLLLAIAIPYILGVSFIGISLLLFTVERFIPKITAIVIAALALLTGNVITTYCAKSLADKINGFGQHIGLSASSGQKFLIITWIAFGLTVIVAAYWTHEFRQKRRARQVIYQSKLWKASS
ncbi:uncharacterized protein MKZ38_009393 [Zalerion maritima]|uniref:Uncharacterized protein n=1 Tax=Zalerion maritima TaxID=339359 RepID=A0AAD5RV95_9PEZI|nr:uncharacterized protein MKZ38_009393 [Zalerion maritima]